MKTILRPLLVAAATLLSATQLIWMGAFVAATIDGLRRPEELKYTGILLLAGWWTGFACAMIFARRTLSMKRGSLWHFGGIVLGLIAGILIEAQTSDPVLNLPYGYFEIAILSWVGLGLLAPRLTRTRIAPF